MRNFILKSKYIQNLIVKRIVTLPLLLLLISFGSFFLANLSPSDPAEVTLRVNDIVPTKEAIEETRKELGLDRPFLEQYMTWVSNIVLKGDFGFSYESKKSVLKELLQATPITFYLTIFALGLIVFFSFFFGILCAVYENHWFDKTIRSLIFITTATPSFWLGLLLIWFFSLKLNLLPSGGYDSIYSLILPAFTLAITYISTFIRIIRNSLIEIKDAPFIIYAKLRGLKKSKILKHQIKNIIPPFIVALNMSIPRLFAGTIIVENVFGLPGLGRICIQAIFNRDFPIIQTYILFMAILFIVFNLIADLWIVIKDPRKRV
ncbi:nickel ABC transporter, permease protein [Halarcobacter ebronensis]|uniref:nickel/cobalt ABC transporter permease n=1 Tax=Halarcobacter ebronensis TaxID=1462615 RepID=UPI001E56A2E0|nr:nickel/cobalt ABC transporter permease [Halarcobacter ebronensis]QKF82510.1 nickel ABC transporter, permease protein [Halarcobacter ebronensis]